MKLRRYIVRGISRQLDLPMDVTDGEMFVSVSGATQAKIENHLGLLECSPRSVGVRVCDGIVRVTGNDLVIREMMAQTLEVKGKIESIVFLT